ncbi:MAG TPA: hypothetical protein VIC62_22210 [Nakamurella sp.]
MARHSITTAALLIAASISTVVVLATSAGCSTPAAPAPPPAAGDAAPPLRTPQPRSGEPLPATTAATPARTPAAVTTSNPTFRASAPGGPPTGNSWAITGLDAPPNPPRLLALPADFASPPAVAQAYLRAWCYAPAEDPANTNITNTTPWMTAAGWAEDAARAVDAPTWARTRSAGVSTICGPATASISPQAPNTPDAAWVAVSAQQARVAGGAVIGQSPVSMVRRILRSPDGRWLVDVRVMAG